MIQSRLKAGEGRMALIIIALLFGFLALGGPVEASPIASFTGSTFVSNPTSPGIDGTINFAVFTSANFSTDAAGILSSFVAGLSSVPLDLGSGIYVYAYQVANSPPNSTTITNASFGRDPNADVTSWGYFRDNSTGKGIVFTDAEGQVSATNSLNPGATSVGFAVDSGVNPSLLWRASTSLQASLSIAAGGTSSLMVYTSHYGPGWFTSQINGAGVGAMGAGEEPGAGAQVPEPGTLLLMTLGLAGLAGFRRGFHGKKGEKTMTGGERHPRRSFIITLLLAMGLLGLAGRGEAVPISAFTGNTFVDSGVVNGVQGVSGTINYAVFTGADFSLDAAGILSPSSFVAGTGSGTLNLSALVYVFQITNNGFNPAVPISAMSVGISGVTPTSWGYFANSVFVDPPSAGGANVDATNNLGSVESKPPLGSDPRIGVASVGFNNAAVSAKNPTQVVMNAGVDVFNLFIAPELFAGDTSSLLVYTAQDMPTFVFAQVNNQGTTAYGPVPGPIDSLQTVPEPGTLLLLGSGLIGLAARPLWRRRSEGLEKGEG